MRSRSTVVFAAIAISLNAQSNAPYNWTGFYPGGVVSVSSKLTEDIVRVGADYHF